MSLLHGLFLSCLWTETHPEVSNPVPNEPDEIRDRPQGAEVTAPRSADE